MIAIIAAMTEKGRVIGNNGSLPWKIPEELGLFRSTTVGATVVMGRKTFEETKILPNRKNIIVSRTISSIKGADVCRTLEEALEKAKSYGREIFIIGGGEIFSEALRKGVVDRMYLSYIRKEYPGNTRFPKFDISKWDYKREEYQGFYRLILEKRR